MYVNMYEPAVIITYFINMQFGVQYFINMQSDVHILYTINKLTVPVIS